MPARGLYDHIIRLRYISLPPRIRNELRVSTCHHSETWLFLYFISIFICTYLMCVQKI